MNRPDISIGIVQGADGTVSLRLVQGAHDFVGAVLDREDGLYYSQLAHRGAYRDATGWHICLASHPQAQYRIAYQARRSLCTDGGVCEAILRGD